MIEVKAENAAEILSKKYNLRSPQREIVTIMLIAHLNGYEKIHWYDVIKKTTFKSGSIKSWFQSRKKAWEELIIHYDKTKNAPIKKGYVRLNIVDSELRIKIFGS